MTRRTFLLILLCFLSAAGGSTAQCLAAQRSALIRLKNGFSTFSSSSNLSSWRNDSDCCRWSGVTCNVTTGEITGLDLNNFGLSGNLSTALFDLSSLRILNLSLNNFIGSILSEGFERLSSLAALNLSNSGFGGQVPFGISRLINLVSLDLSRAYEGPDQLKLESPNLRELIQNLTNLENLNLDGVNISADGVDWGSAVADSVPKLRVLSLSGCSLLGPVIESLSKLKSLTELHLDRNGLSSGIPEFLGTLSLLKSLRLSSCNLTGSLPDSIFQLNKLKIIDLSQNPMLGGELPVALGNLNSLEVLLLSNCNFSGSIPYSVSNLTALVRIDLSTNKFSGDIPLIDSHSNISIISLGQNNFSGSIPSSFGNLQKLTILDVQNNSISGPIPKMLFGLPLLRNLQLNQNKLSGNLQDSVNASSTLETIDLSDNQLQGPIPEWIHNLTGVKVLTLSSNRLTGKIYLNLFGKLQNLSNLDLSDNAFTVESEMSNSLFPKIGRLNLANCNMTDFPAFIRDKSTISHLDLSSNRIHGDVPNWIWSTGNLPSTYLNLSHNLFTGFGNSPPDLTKTSLRVIDLHSNKLVGQILLPSESNVVIDYSRNNLTSSIPVDIGFYLNSSLFFSLSRNNIFGRIPKSICSAHYLQVLDFSYNNLTGPIPSCFANMMSLRILNLRGNILSGSIPSTFSEECNLRTMDLNDNQLSGILPESMLRCGRLEILDLGNNQMYGSLPSWMCKLSELRVLVLRTNKFNGNLNSFGSMNVASSLLQILDLSSNNFSGNLPSKVIYNWKAMMGADKKVSSPIVRYRFLSLSQLYYQDMVSVTSKGLDMELVKILTIFTAIDLSSNKFEGNIPEALGQLTSLSVLNISYNMITGVIPKSIGRLKWLESLDLSHNMLSGSIPPELASLTFLSALDLSYNHLVGAIPRTPQFLTFSSSSFINNPGLCGSPLEACLNKNVSSPEPADGPDWNHIFMGLGFGGGLALVFGSLIICEKWRKWLNGNVDKMLWALVFSYDCVLAKCWDVKVNTEDWIEGGSLEIPEKRHKRRFCVFCTGLDFISGKVAIHHVECCCYRED